MDVYPDHERYCVPGKFGDSCEKVQEKFYYLGPTSYSQEGIAFSTFWQFQGEEVAFVTGTSARPNETEQTRQLRELVEATWAERKGRLYCGPVPTAATVLTAPPPKELRNASSMISRPQPSALQVGVSNESSVERDVAESRCSIGARILQEHGFMFYESGMSLERAQSTFHQLANTRREPVFGGFMQASIVTLDGDPSKIKNGLASGMWQKACVNVMLSN